MRSVSVILGLCVWCFGSTPAGSQIITDRPTFSASPLSVDPGRVQLEIGTSWIETDHDRELTVGEPLVRVGLADRWEARLDTGSWRSVDSVGGDDRSGFTNAAVGFKVELLGSSSGVAGGVDLALLASTSVPTGDDELVSDAWEPSVTLAAGWTLTDRVSLGANAGVARSDDDGQRFTPVSLSGVVNLVLVDRWTAFAELYGRSSERYHGPTTATAQAGVLYLVREDVQLDLRVARRVTDEGPDLVVGIGAAWRWGRAR